MLDKGQAVMEGLRAALANGEDVDNETEDCVRDLRWVGEKDLLLDSLRLILRKWYLRGGMGLGCATKLAKEIM